MPREQRAALTRTDGQKGGPWGVGSQVLRTYPLQRDRVTPQRLARQHVSLGLPKGWSPPGAEEPPQILVPGCFPGPFPAEAQPPQA